MITKCELTNTKCGRCFYAVILVSLIGGIKRKYDSLGLSPLLFHVYFKLFIQGENIQMIRKNCFTIYPVKTEKNSFPIALRIRIGRAADQPLHQTVSVLLSDQALRFFIFLSDVMFLLSLIP